MTDTAIDAAMSSGTPGAAHGPGGRPPARPHATVPYRAATLRRLAEDLERSARLRLLLYRVSMVFPSVVALLLLFVGVYPIVFSPARTLIPTLVSIVGAGLSFASVTFSAARAIDGDEDRTLRLATAGAMLLRFALGMAVVLALATTRARVVETFGEGNPADLALRGIMAVVTVTAICMVYFGVHTLVALLGPDLEEEAARRLAYGREAGA